MPRVSDDEIQRWVKETSEEVGVMLIAGLPSPRATFVDRAIFDLQDARTALKAILSWKHRTTNEPPLTYIERVAKEVVG